MDGITGSPTLGGVVLATSAAAGSAVYKVRIGWEPEVFTIRDHETPSHRDYLLVCSGPLQESDRRDHVRSDVPIFLTYRFMQRRAVVADLPGSVLLWSGNHALGEAAVGDVTLR